MADGRPTVEGLSREVEKLKEENLLLIRDLENMCLQSAPTAFSSSMVVSERIYSAETQMAKARSDLHAVTAERDSLREDIAQMRRAKGTSDSTWRTERARADKLEKELSFYQEQSMQTMAERDEALEEVEQARQGSLHLEASLREAQSRADREADLRGKLQKSLDDSKAKAASLEAKVAELSKLAEVKEELDRALARLAEERQRGGYLAEANRELERELLDTGEKLAASQKECEGLRCKLADAEASASQADEEHKRELEKLQGLLLSAEATADDANANREEFEDSLYAARAEVELSRKAAKSAHDGAGGPEAREPGPLGQDPGPVQGRREAQVAWLPLPFPIVPASCSHSSTALPAFTAKRNS
mmetsp:Transcript_38750/g.109569  ORF Transcript_38750/g.109569 Transcript_38750/m.109569 type:complete len:363 (-) Transcript_38750:205-1293(-)